MGSAGHAQRLFDAVKLLRARALTSCPCSQPQPPTQGLCTTRPSLVKWKVEEKLPPPELRGRVGADSPSVPTAVETER